jgi:hypothetical protein
MKNTITSYWYIIAAILIAILVSSQYWKAWQLSRAQKSKHPFPRSILVASVIGFILGITLSVIALKCGSTVWEARLFALFLILFFCAIILGLFVALTAGAFRSGQTESEALARPVETSWALTALVFIVGTVAGILVAMILIMAA